MLQFTRDHGNNKKGDQVGYGEIDHVDYLIRVGVLEEVKEEKNPLYPLHTFSKSKKKDELLPKK